MTDNARQIAYWNEVAGPKWVTIEAAMEARLSGVDEVLLAHATPRAGEHVLEIGCGTGTTTARLAAVVGPSGHVVAVDVSKPMLDVARLRLAAQSNVTLSEADAAVARFDRRFDLLVSRFGIMFFEDPIIAFTNLYRALNPAGRLACIAWAPIADNPHWSVPLALAIEQVGSPKPRRPHAPGPLGFDDPAYVTSILARAGFTDILVRASPVILVGRSVDDEAHIAVTMGPAGALLDEKDADAATRARLVATIRSALPGYVDPTPDPPTIRLPATVHVITARRV